MKPIILALIFGLANLHGALISKPPHENHLPQNINYERAISADNNYEDTIKERLAKFDFSNYDIYLVHQLGKFFLDSKPDWIKDLLKRNIAWENYIASYIKQYAKPGTLALDIGAHIGTHTLNISRAVGPEGQVIAFEPQPKTFCELFMNTEINGPRNVTCFWGALGDKSEELQLPNFIPQAEVVYLYDFSYGDSGNIAPMITLDSLNLDNISFMKIDVDGCDEIFLEGAHETILRNKPVMVMEIYGGYDIDTASSEIKDKILNVQRTIRDMGYSLQRISIHDYLCIPQ